QHGPGAERLGRVEHPPVRPERLQVLAAARPDVLFVADVQRGAEFGGQVPHVQISSCSSFRSSGAAGGWSAGSTSPWRGPAGCATRLMGSFLPSAVFQRRGGASMPSSPRPAASPVRAASASHSRSLLMSGIFLKLLVLILSIV